MIKNQKIIAKYIDIRPPIDTHYKPLYQPIQAPHIKPCIKCSEIINQLYFQIEKLLQIKIYHQKMVNKKQEQIKELSRLFGQSEMKLKNYQINMQKKDQQLNKMQKKYEMLQQSCVDLTQFKEGNQDMINFLKAREFQLLNKVYLLQKKILSKSSLFEQEKLLCQQYLDCESSQLYNTKQQKIKSITEQFDIQDRENSFNMRQTIKNNYFKNDQKSIIKSIDKQNLKFNKYFIRMENKINNLFDEQKILALRNDILEMKLDDNSNLILKSTKIQQNQ